ncbi:ABC transporter ATP-binding protein [Atopobium sp. oral taxon 810]|uniref:ABC transporter ATP-binding protein n=1 Tax=Atopobium sp. oral taxon 810 TaxID=712158 RepID=UPI000396D386|nr:ABC transporter ATP-binding protein [Atopobium sp. oral taxon 810]ERI06243.1 ABC transporter, ATP-binding protein [Atopobium sp. oral taxon 810 str. F0209]
MSMKAYVGTGAQSAAHFAKKSLDMDNKLPLGSLDLSGEICDLRLRGIGKSYGEFALQSVSLDVPRGSIVGLVGRNGAGKTTLMKIALGCVKSDSGSVELFGKTRDNLSGTELTALKARIGYVSSVCAYPLQMSVAQVATMYSLAYPKLDYQLLENLLERMGLLKSNPKPHRSYAARKKVGELSRGMGMKLQLACVLACGADLLVMDEPTAGLDPIVRDEVLDILRECMGDGTKSILISSHITSDLEHIADYIVMLEEGKIAFASDCDRIYDEMGVAHLRGEELEHLLASGYIPAGQIRIVKRDFSWDVLVPNRAQFERNFPNFAIDKATIDETMTLVAKGELR